MSRIIDTNSSGKERELLLKAVVVAQKELSTQPDMNSESRDLAAFIAQALIQVSISVEKSSQAWENRGYWVKADQFRTQWSWTTRSAGIITEAILQGNWRKIIETSELVGQKLSHIKVSSRHGLGRPWENAWNRQTKTPGRN
jgi:hypothetical protein